MKKQMNMFTMISVLVLCVIFINVSQASLLVYEGFDYNPAALNGQNGGSGWGGAWAVTAGTMATGNGSLTPPSGYNLTPIGGKNEATSSPSAERTLSTPISMDPATQQIYYVSQLFRRNDSVSAGGGEFLDLFMLRDGTANTVRYGSGSGEDLQTFVGATIDKTATGFYSLNTTYLLVGKIIANPAGTPDESFGILYEVGVDSVALEPEVADWDVHATNDIIGDIDNIKIRYGANTETMHVDEFRIGTTWKDVTGVEVVGQVIETDGQTVVFEKNETSDTFTVSLLSEPTDVVTVTVNKLNDPNGNIDIDPTVLNIPIEDWNTLQPVTVTAIDDVLPEGEQIIELAFQVTSNDNFFEGGFVAHVLVTVVDDDSAGVVFSPLAIEVAESGQQDQYTIVLASAPSTNVHVFPDDPAGLNQVSFDKTELVFTSVNWEEPQTVTVTAIDDETLELDPHATSIEHSIESGDLEYNGFAADSVSVSILENECGAWGFNPMDFDQTCEVNLGDFALFVLDWLGCSRPHEVGCVRF